MSEFTRRIKKYALAIFISTALFSMTAAADPSQEDTAHYDLLAFAIGYYDIHDDKEAADFRIEYRFGEPIIYELRTWLGLEVTSDGAVFGLGGLLYDFEFADKYHFVPSFGTGLYADGGGKDLGNTVQFRTQLELQYEFDNKNHISIAASHISNADLGDFNPGSEVISVYYSIPF